MKKQQLVNLIQQALPVEVQIRMHDDEHGIYYSLRILPTGQRYYIFQASNSKLRTWLRLDSVIAFLREIGVDMNRVSFYMPSDDSR